MKSKTLPLLAHQKESLKFMAKRDRVFDMSDPGTMKTRVELEDFLRNRERGKAMLVIAPKSLLQTAWGDDCERFTPDLTYTIASADDRVEALLQPTDIIITNTDAVKAVAKMKKDFFKRFERIVVDESSMFKHHTSARSRALNSIKKYFPIRRNMTGSPNTRSITDVWHQAFFLDDGKRLGNSFFAFRSATCIPEQVGPKAEMIRWNDKPGAEEAVSSMLADITIRHKFEDCIDIPPTHRQVLKYIPTRKQVKAYKGMEEDAILLMKKGMVSAVNAAAARTKLLQISSGAVYESPTKYHLIDTARYEMVIDLVDARKHTIVFYLWKHQRDEIARMAKARNIPFCVFDGDATDKQKVDMTHNFQAGFYQMILCHPKSAAHGLTWTRASTTLWPSPPDDLEWWVQGNRRHARGGQTKKTETIIILADKTIEMGIYKRLEMKQARMDNLLDLM